MQTLDDNRPRWYSIKEAAEYLDVGEPTLYRWMKDGKITYRKVGDSTRFVQADLDQVVEVYPSSRDAGKVALFCPICHHDELIEGRVRGTGLVFFEPKKTRFWTLSDSSIKTTCLMCRRCGAISWQGDLSKLKAVQVKAKGEEPKVSEKTSE